MMMLAVPSCVTIPLEVLCVTVILGICLTKMNLLAMVMLVLNTRVALQPVRTMTTDFTNNRY